MSSHQEKPAPRSNRQLIWQYIGLGSQLLISLGLAVALGYYADKKISLGFPLLVWLLPLLILIYTIYKAIKDTGKK
jgi:hypothetical protein